MSALLREKNVKILSNEVRDTQQNSRYSAKNNVAIRMIATFMPKPSMFNLLFLICFNLLTGYIHIILQLRALFVITWSEYLTYLIMDQTVENFRVFCSIQHKTADNSRQLNLKHLLVTAVKFLKSFSGKIEKIEFQPQIKKKINITLLWSKTFSI